MRTDVAINGGTTPTTNYVTWTPSRAEIWLSNSDGVVNPVNVTLRNQRPDVGGQVVFFDQAGAPGADELTVDLHPDGTRVAFLVAGKPPHASTADKDAAIEVIETATGQPLSVTQLMVRIRKDANGLTAGERDRFIAAFATLNNQGMGRYSVFRDMHRSNSYYEAHGNSGFLSWHRAYLLDLERELQDIDPSVTLPYWRFDQRAPHIFSPEFFGRTDDDGTLVLAPNNPIQNWRTDNGIGITRVPIFDQENDPAFVLSEDETLDYGSTYIEFEVMEGDPHGNAHTSFDGWIFNPGTAPRDPLFFLLHCNVDRLWAKWQRTYGRFDEAVADTYPHQGSAGQPGAERIGHNRLDTMWPWNGVTGFGNPADRPFTAPGGNLQASTIVSAPSPTPTVGEMIDWQGWRSAAGSMGFDYDDVPFQP